MEMEIWRCLACSARTRSHVSPSLRCSGLNKGDGKGTTGGRGEGRGSVSGAVYTCTLYGTTPARSPESDELPPVVDFFIYDVFVARARVDLKLVGKGKATHTHSRDRIPAVWSESESAEPCNACPSAEKRNKKHRNESIDHREAKHRMCAHTHMRPGRASKSKLFALARATLAQCWRAAPHRDAQHTL